MLYFSILILGIFYRLYIRLFSSFESVSGLVGWSILDSDKHSRTNFEVLQAYFELM
jgi:hypothetical protein